MGHVILEEVITLLSNEGIRTDYSYPASHIYRVTEPVAAVSLEKVDMKDNTVQVLVDILSPKELGGYVCQEQALKACLLLEGYGAVCRQDSCSFLNKANLFRVPVRAVFRGRITTDGMEELPRYTVTTGSVSLDCVCGFSAKQGLSGSVASLEDAMWEITVEEFFPWGMESTQEAAAPFTTVLRCEGHTEQFENCAWIARERVAEKFGIRQTRKATATGRTLT